MNTDIKSYVAQRDVVLRSLDVDAVIELVRRAGDSRVSQFDRKNILAGMHKARMNIVTFSPEEQAEPLAWLTANGFDAEIK